MKNMLKRLDRLAERLVNAIDADVQQPVVRIVTGEVFSDGAPKRQHAEAPIVLIEIDEPQDAVHAAHAPCQPQAPAANLTREPVLA